MCLWAQRLDPTTKRPEGPPYAVYHVHGTRLSMANMDLTYLDLSVARDKVVFNMSELTGNVWLAKLEGDR